VLPKLFGVASKKTLLKAVIAREGGGSANLNFRPLAVAPPSITLPLRALHWRAIFAHKSQFSASDS